MRNYLELKELGGKRGIYTKIKIGVGEAILEVRGNIYNEEDARKDENLLEVGKKVYKGRSGGIEDYIGHSCEPNCKLHIVGNRVIIYSIYEIGIGKELTIDYSLSSTDREWKMECRCGSIRCRKVISGIWSIPEDRYKEYKAKGMVMGYIEEIRR